MREIGEHYGRYRLHLPERARARSLERYGQLSPMVVCRRHERYELYSRSALVIAALKLWSVLNRRSRLKRFVSASAESRLGLRIRVSGEYAGRASAPDSSGHTVQFA